MRVPPMSAEDQRRVKWRILQGFLAVPVLGMAIFLLFIALMLLADREWSVEMFRFIGDEPLRLVVPVVCLGLVLAIENHLRSSRKPD